MTNATNTTGNTASNTVESNDLANRTVAELGIPAGATRDQALAALLEQIMGAYSVSDSEGPLAGAVERFLRRQPHLAVRRHGDTVVASTDFGKAQRVILAGHLDVVPVIDNFPPEWLEPGDARIRGDVASAHPGERVMWGRGATDMKASDAVMLYLAAVLDGRNADPNYDLTYVFYDHEEVAAEKNGLRKVVETHPDWITGDFAIIGEPTDCGIEGGCNGTMRFDVITHGVAAHSARAWMGSNAIHKAAEILDRLAAYEPKDVTVDGLVYREGVNATLISGGKGTNVIPDECRVHVNYRFAPDKTLAEAKALMIGADAGAELGNGEHVATGGMFEGFGIEMKDESPSARPGMDSPLAASLARLVKERTGREPLAKLGWTDVARFAILGIPAVNLGAGSPLLAHKHDEQLPESDLALMADILERWLVG
ncbi:MAG: succinyl-diaminopimelate desuccinylase [Bifidobacterium scardovii]|uniref:succinyl-diaminopimelate desuccinylase n=1 Tax=Bifidobacterium scardovii TaxID=158787 RepID=UPI0009E3568F|nr:succinyl-diaminopimelate desuccinylase [Bifidobacterium scardovii]MBS6948821.1 succinyl-diaminopimelate desuccinylase [Bifidobacterium scardovii]MDU2421518.1 succinyl-diaminopimelate desuccinylase [Bifidobacterium scardovii]MDU3737351.1 succinyl-diaminopimelate desuccinylase [Bifidobacterium scardovii]MDU5298047.1 succinyl-diaminopimelate desuccinylase [Bifidobacterium scardovii]MDU5611093.1 succinyl-diaminopimelate desuccinylase [Bifidobacterium scardovii]